MFIVSDDARPVQDTGQSATWPVWPDDYVAIADGEDELLVRPDCVEGFRKLGWHSITDIIACDEIVNQRDLGHRSNGTVKISTSGTDSPDGDLLVYVKRHPDQRGHRVPFPCSDKRRHVSAGVTEAHAGAHAIEHGIPVAPIVAAGQSPSKSGRGNRFDSVFISQGLTDHLPADDFWKIHLAEVEPDTTDVANRRMTFLRALARIARRLHDAKLFHRDMYWCHFMVHEPAPAEFDVRFIDLQRLWQPVGVWQPYTWVKDMAQFWYSIPNTSGAPTTRELRYWFAQYQYLQPDQFSLGVIDRVRFAAIKARAGLYRLREGKP